MFKVLLIEEESGLRAVIDFALCDDFIVFPVENTDQARDKMNGRETRPDLIIMRTFHPGSKDFLLGKHRLAECSHIPVIFLEREGERTKNRADRKSQNNGWYYLDLPVNPARILALAKKCLLPVS